MLDLNDIRSLTDFQRNAKKHARRLRQSGRPEVLTVNGQAELVVQSAKSYQQLVDDAELTRSLRVIEKSLKQARAGQGRPMKDVLHELAAKHKIALP